MKCSGISEAPDRRRSCLPATSWPHVQGHGEHSPTSAVRPNMPAPVLISHMALPLLGGLEHNAGGSISPTIS